VIIHVIVDRFIGAFPSCLQEGKALNDSISVVGAVREPPLPTTGASDHAKVFQISLLGKFGISPHTSRMIMRVDSSRSDRSLFSHSSVRGNEGLAPLACDPSQVNAWAAGVIDVHSLFYGHGLKGN
jgi:hypothetical protein